MRILQFKVTGQNLSKDGDFSGIVAGTKGYLYTEYKRWKVYLVGERKGYRITTNEVEVYQS